MTTSLILILFLLFCPHVFNDVIYISDTDFAKIVDGSTNVLVEFYVPWCGHCKSLAPEWEIVGQIFKPDDDIKIASVDATVATGITKEYGITGFPTIIFFPKGSTKPEEFDGGRTVDTIISWVNNKVGTRRQLNFSVWNQTFGLLYGISKINNSLFYTNTLSIKSAHLLLSKSKLFYNNFLNNNGELEIGENFKKILENAKQFIYSNKLWDRSELQEILTKVTSTNEGGKFGCLLGGKSTGKSLILNNLNSSKIIVVDLRNNNDMLTGLIDSLRERKDILAKSKILEAVVEQSLNFLKVKSESFFDFKKFFNTFFDTKSEIPKTFQSIILTLVKHLDSVTIIFDEANLALTIDNSSSEENIKIVKNSLSLFTAMIKQRKKLNILLVSSEHSFPFRLSNPKLNFNLLDFTDYIFAGEIPPNEMYHLLTDVWEMDSALAIAFIDIYGGHIWDIYQALRQLETMKSDFVFLDPLLTKSVRKCLSIKEEKPGELVRMKKSLEKLAIEGFIPLEDSEDPIARVISEFGVGGVVMKRSKIIGLNMSVWGKYPNYDYGIIPSKQSMRLAIAKILVDTKEMSYII